jgi:very-short-patch-repair endonuclease
VKKIFRNFTQLTPFSSQEKATPAGGRGMSSTTQKPKHTMSLSNDPRLREIAKQLCRDLRKRQTNAEEIFWQAVRDRKFLDLKFYRQHPLFFDYLSKETFFIADFFCHERKLVVEIDGKIHDYRKDHDKLRTFIINMMGIDVIRFRNEEIENNLGGVLARIKKLLRKNDTIEQATRKT